MYYLTWGLELSRKKWANLKGEAAGLPELARFPEISLKSAAERPILIAKGVAELAGYPLVFRTKL